eukprot:GFYU01045892.1.p1 GENE.GFYU01045892.1~~GFYU01045892.1.p1  ORF type:complete len:132 (+),score=19.13 GFYU01045892.1:49-396(+)
MSTWVFVYGTLKRGFYNHPKIATATFRMLATTTDKYPMVLGAWAVPFVLPTRGMPLSPSDVIFIGLDFCASTLGHACSIVHCSGAENDRRTRRAESDINVAHTVHTSTSVHVTTR